MDKLITNANIITMNPTNANNIEDIEILGGCIGIDNGKIVYVGNNLPDEKANEVIDADGAIVIPGLINAHTHSPMTILRGLKDDVTLQDWLFNYIFPKEETLTPDDIYKGTVQATREMIRGGTTCFCDMYFHAQAIYKAIDESRMRANLGTGMSSMETDIDYNTLNSVKDILVLKEKNNASGKIKLNVAPHAIYTSSLDFLKWACKFAEQNEFEYHTHISETEQENIDCYEKYGTTPTQVLADCGMFKRRMNAAHCVYLTDDDIEIFKQTNASITHNPTSNLKLGSGIAPIHKYIQNGINVALGTDGAASNNALDMLAEVKLAAILHKGATKNPTVISSYEALKMVTVGGAYALGREHELGKITEGYAADFVFIDSHADNVKPFSSLCSAVVYSANASNVLHTMVGGEFLMKDKVLQNG
ncbi:MAG: amidohydrolase [Clostridiales bacterium]|jgi:5-methylthioadenosine/S-adenosylhomocysteine deaminase|nr:amidohydrolase [Clostridiales bacterium]